MFVRAIARSGGSCPRRHPWGMLETMVNFIHGGSFNKLDASRQKYCQYDKQIKVITRFLHYFTTTLLLQHYEKCDKQNKS